MSKPKPDPDKVIFTFNLTAQQAQTIYNVVECMREEPDLFREIWKTKADRARVDNARRRYNAQLERNYRANPGVEV